MGYVAAAGLILTAISTALSVNSSMQQSAAQDAQAKYESQVARNNSILAQRAADRAKLQGQIDAQDKAAEGRRLMGRQLAVLAGNGIDVSSGSALDIVGDTASASSTDQQRILNNAQATADNYLAQGSNFNAQSQLYKNSAGGGAYDAVGTALSGVGAVADKWYKYSNSGMLDSSPSYSGIGTGTDYARFGGTF